MNTPRLCALYSAFFDRTNKNNALEEFLIAAGVKTPVYLSFEQQEFSFSDLLEDVVVEVPIKRNTWGYLGFAIHADGDFVESSIELHIYHKKEPSLSRAQCGKNLFHQCGRKFLCRH